ncbi:MAG: mechanosensitive ion channel [Deltaproteobacteria bacterium]|nr:mechanosensitive ion channel [Deltaproteobacteria bacterium]
MDFGWSVLIGIVVASFMAVVKDVIQNAVSGIWLRVSKELVPGDEVEVKSKEFGRVEGVVARIFLRNVEIRLGDGRVLLMQTSRVYDEDVIRKRGADP